MTALICSVALAVAGGAGVNAVSIAHANGTHLTNSASTQTPPTPIGDAGAADSKPLKPP